MSSSLSFARTLFDPTRLALDVCISAAITAAVWAALWPFVAMDGLALIALMLPPVLVLVVLLYVAPLIAVPLVGIIVTGRPGFFIGPFLLAAAVCGNFALEAQQRLNAFATLTSAVAKLTSDTAEPLHPEHTLLAVEDNQDGHLCSSVCIKVLAMSNHTLALRHNSGRNRRSWVLYSLTEGPPCRLRENAKLALEFLLTGFPGKCATSTPISDFEDGSYLRRVDHDARRPSSELPDGFVGNFYEYFERVDGQDRLLARHVKGEMSSTTKYPLLRLFEKKTPPIDAGPPIDRLSFLANAMRTDVKGLLKPADPFPFDEVLTEIEKYFDLKEAIGAETFRYARWVWMQTAANATVLQPQLVRERILRLFATHDPFRTALGIETMWSLPLVDRVFPDDVLLGLMFVPMDGKASSLLQKELERQFATGRSPAPSDVREQAKAHLSDPDLAPWKLRILSQLSDSR